MKNIKWIIYLYPILSTVLLISYFKLNIIESKRMNIELIYEHS